MKRPRHATALGVAFACAIASSTVSAQADDENERAETAAVVSNDSVATDGPEPSATDAPDSTDGPAVTEAPVATASPATTEAPAPADPPLVEAGATIAVAAITAEVGSQPLMEWTPVDGADEYRVVVRDGEGDAYWAWSGPESQVRLGGGDVDGGGGPTLPAGAEWSVVALAADGAFVASSAWTALT